MVLVTLVTLVAFSGLGIVVVLLLGRCSRCNLVITSFLFLPFPQPTQRSWFRAMHTYANCLVYRRDPFDRKCLILISPLRPISLNLTNCIKHQASRKPKLLRPPSFKKCSDTLYSYTQTPTNTHKHPIVLPHVLVLTGCLSVSPQLSSTEAHMQPP